MLANFNHMMLMDALMLIYPFSYTIHNGHTEVTVDMHDDTYFFYIRRSDNVKKMWSVEKHSAMSNASRNNNVRDEDCIEAEAELLRLEAVNK